MKQAAKGRNKKTRFNGADVFIVVLILVCILGIAGRVAVANSKEPLFTNEERELFFTAQCPAAVAEALSPGDALTIDEGRAFGTLLEGFTVYGEGDTVTVYGSIMTRGREVFGLYFVSGAHIVSLGDELKLIAEDYSIDVKLTDVDGAE